MKKPLIIGLYGCYCHPFETWEEEEKHRKQKLKVGDIVQHRCRKTIHKVLEIKETGYCSMSSKFHPSELGHAQELILIKKQSNIQLTIFDSGL